MARNLKAIIIFCALFLGIISVLIVSMLFYKNKMDVQFIIILIALIFGLPIFLTVGIFGVYRNLYLKEFPRRSEHVSWDTYILPMVIFIVFSIVFTAGLIFWDSKASEIYASRLSIAPSFIVGRSSIPIDMTLAGGWTDTETGKKYIVESKTIRFPTTIFWVAYIGAVVSILGTMMLRFTIRHLVARTYIHGAIHIFYAMIATASFYIFVQVWPEALGQSQIDPLEKMNMLMLFAFLAGMFPWSIIQWVTGRLLNQLGLKSRRPMSLTEIQGIDPQLAIFLYEEGVWSIEDLSIRNPDMLAKNIHLDKELVENWHDQARLIVELGERDLVERFRKLGINDWGDLEVLSSIHPRIELSNLTKIPGESNEISPVLIRVLKIKYEAGKSSKTPVGSRNKEKFVKPIDGMTQDVVDASPMI